LGEEFKLAEEFIEKVGNGEETKVTFSGCVLR
jgi:hypothetical protein